MDKKAYADKFSETSDILGQLAAKLENPDYCETTSRAEFIRDISIALEQGQKVVETFTEIIEEIFK